MRSLPSHVTLLLDMLGARDVPVIVIGTTALALHGGDLTPDDLDIFVEERELEAVSAVVDGSIVERGGSFIKLRLHDGHTVDLYWNIASGETFDALRGRAARVSLGTTEVDVAALSDLETMLLAAGRPKDRARAQLAASLQGR